MLPYYFDQRDRPRAKAEERAEAEHRHHEMMTALTGTIAALTGLLERNGQASDQSELIEQLRRRVNELKTENARLRNGDSIAGGS